MLNKAKRFAAKAIATVAKVVKRVFKKTIQVVKYYFTLWSRYKLSMFMMHFCLLMLVCGLDPARMVIWIIINSLIIAWAEYERNQVDYSRARYNEFFANKAKNTQVPKNNYNETQIKMHKVYVNLMAKANRTTNEFEREAFANKAKSIKVKYAL